MRFNVPSKGLLATSAIVLALSVPSFAQTANETGTDEMQQPPAAVEQPSDSHGTTMDHDAPMLKNTMTDEPVDPLKNQRQVETIPGATTDDTLPDEPILTAQKAGQLVTDEVIGMDVRNPDDESIGSIDALVVDRDNRVVAGIVSVGGFLGLGAKEVAVNWKEFTFQPEQEVAFVSLSREQLEQAPAFRERDEVQAQLRTEDRRREVERQQDRLSDQAEPATEETGTTD